MSLSIVSTRAADALRLEVARLCKELLPEAIALSDAFGYTDWELDRYVSGCHERLFQGAYKTDGYSALGVYDGRVYNALWDQAQTEPLNQSEITEGYLVSVPLEPFCRG